MAPPNAGCGAPKAGGAPAGGAPKAGGCADPKLMAGFALEAPKSKPLFAAGAAGAPPNWNTPEAAGAAGWAGAAPNGDAAAGVAAAPPKVKEGPDAGAGAAAGWAPPNEKTPLGAA